MKSVVMFVALLPFVACEFPPIPPIPNPGGEGEAEGECGECWSDHDCPGGRCDVDACLPWCACPECDVCAGHCVPPFCGGIAGIPCPPGYECVDDPSDDCDPERGGADCGGICIPTPETCGDGICDPNDASRRGEDCQTCPEDCGGCRPCRARDTIACLPGYHCADDPLDGCEGRDCQRICVPSDDCLCPAVWDPVCGQDGVTYSNECGARCAGVGSACHGECPCAPEQCGECTSDHECPGSRCNKDACLPWCACPECDNCAGHCEP